MYCTPYTPIINAIALLWENPHKDKSLLFKLSALFTEKVLYHEIGHHRHRHNFGTDPDQEKEADRYAFRVMKKSHISRGASVRKRKSSGSSGGKVGLGGYVFNDRNGAVSRIGIKGTYAYHLNFRHSQLSFGLSLVAYQFRLDDDLIHLLDPGDELWLGTHKAVFIPDADFGVYYTAKNYWAGISVDQLFESTLKIGDSGYDRYLMERNYYLIGGYDFELNRDLIFSPSTLLKYAENGKFQADVSGKFYFQQSYWAGLTYRTGQTIIILVGVSYDKFIFGYAYDIGLNSIMKYSYGTHEFTFIAKFGDNARRYRWLNRF